MDLLKAEYCKPNVLAYKALAALGDMKICLSSKRKEELEKLKEFTTAIKMFFCEKVPEMADKLSSRLNDNFQRVKLAS